MTVAKSETNQLLWAVKSLQAFLKMKGEEQKILKLATLEELNRFIDELNQNLDDKLPHFSLVTKEGSISGVMAHITLFQHIVKQGLKPAEATPLWQQAYLLWQHVEMQEIAPFYGITKLSGLIKEANRLLPEEWHLPTLDLDSYE